MQPTAQAVGRKWKAVHSQRGERAVVTQTRPPSPVQAERKLGSFRRPRQGWISFGQAADASRLDQRSAGFSDGELDGRNFNDCKNVTICQRCCSGSLDQTGMPRRTTPLLRIQNSVPGVACCTSSRSKLGPFLVPPALIP
jgi:hypothetical protein